MLTCMFVKFDQLTSAYRIYKLCTIGDAYVALTQPVLSVSDEDVLDGCRRMVMFFVRFPSFLVCFFVYKGEICTRDAQAFATCW